MDKDTGVILNDEMVSQKVVKQPMLLTKCMSRRVEKDDFATPGVPDAFGLKRECHPRELGGLPA